MKTVKLTMKKLITKMIQHLTLLLSIIVIQNDAARILAVFPVPSLSHQFVFRALTQEIAKRGHEVTFITPLPAFNKGSAPKNLNEIDVSNETMPLWQAKNMKSSIGPSYFTNRVWYTLHSLTLIFENQIKNPEVRRIIESGQKFDLLLLEGWLRLPMAFARFFNAPIIKVNSLGALFDNDFTFGIPIHQVIFPRSFHHKIYNMSLLDIFWSVSDTIYINRMLKTTHNNENLMLRRVFGEDFPDIDDYIDNNHMLFLNIHKYWDGNHPIPMSVVNIGGIQLKPAEDLPKDLKSYLDSSKQGVIYVSFGTSVMVSTLPKDMLLTFMKVFSEVPYNIIWKWDVEELPGQADNIKFVKWVPQADLLKHPNLKLFITQAGMQSTEESIAACVPVIAIPMIADQWFNAETFVKHGIGLKFEHDEITEKSLKESIDLVAGDDSYRQRACKLRDLINDLPQTPVERMVWWLEYVLKHQGGRHLRAPAANLPAHLYYELELLVITATCVITALFVISLTLFYIVRIVLRKLSSFGVL